MKKQNNIGYILCIVALACTIAIIALRKPTIIQKSECSNCLPCGLEIGSEVKIVKGFSSGLTGTIEEKIPRISLSWSEKVKPEERYYWYVSRNGHKIMVNSEEIEPFRTCP